MGYEMKDNSGSLFKNDKREKDTHAHARGSALIDGVDYFVDAWTNTDKNGNKYQSLKFKRKDKQPAQSGGGWDAPADDLDDQVPF
jgi:hypothetical protein